MPIRLEWDICPDWPGRDESSFHRRISACTRNRRPFKIGITGDPEQRKAGYDGTYDRMIVLYETKSKKKARKFEKRLIDYYGDRTDNEKRGGGPLSGPPFYLYVVTNR